MKAYSVMNVIHLRWSHRNECDLRTDIGTWITSSFPTRSGCKCGWQQAVMGFPYETREHMFQGQPNEIYQSVMCLSVSCSNVTGALSFKGCKYHVQ